MWSVKNFPNPGAAKISARRSGLTGAGFAATQYALFSSLYALPGKLVAGSAGFVVAAHGFPAFFVMTAAIGAPVVLLCLMFGRAPVDARNAALARDRESAGLAPVRAG